MEESQPSTWTTVPASIGAALVGWLALHVAPSLVPQRPSIVSWSLAILILAGAGAIAFAFAYVLPRLWLLLGLSYGAPVIGLGALDIYRSKGNLWPIGVLGLLVLAASILIVAYLGRWWRLRRS